MKSVSFTKMYNSNGPLRTTSKVELHQMKVILRVSWGYLLSSLGASPIQKYRELINPPCVLRWEVLSRQTYTGSSLFKTP